MNEELKKIFTMNIVEEHEEFQIGILINEFRKLAYERTKDEKYLTMPFHPGISHIAYKGLYEEVDYNDSNWWRDAVVKEAEKQYKKTVDSTDTLKALYGVEKIDQDIARSFELLEKTQPSMHNQVKRFIKEIIPLDGNKKKGLTAGWAYGVLFITHLPQYNSINMIESLVHESGHLSLMTKQAFGKLIVNSNDKAYSPFRREERWLNGVLHATYVTVRVCESLKKLEEFKECLTDEEISIARDRYKFNFDIMVETLVNLDNKAIYTEEGEFLMKEVRAKIDQLRATPEIFCN